MTTNELIVLAGAVGAIALVNWYFFFAGRMPTVAVAPEVLIRVDGGYTPNTVRAKVGVPLRLVFDRQDASSCAEEVVIPAFGIKRYLPDRERTTIEVTPREAGRVPFTCGMGMLKGAIVVEP